MRARKRSVLNYANLAIQQLPRVFLRVPEQKSPVKLDRQFVNVKDTSGGLVNILSPGE